MPSIPNRESGEDRIAKIVIKIIVWFIVVMAVATSFNKIHNKLDYLDKRLGEIQITIEHTK